MRDKTIKVAVIGTGMGRFHMDGFAEQENVELTAVCDLNETEAQFYADKYGAKTVTTDYHDLLSDPDVDIISIATPNNLHAPMSIDALNAGKHVLCEKPMA
ncbi:Gfo/Idh/MocA family oxidoreductase, partial [bacterium]|nr:Gfo/Idh/MocA family oxidoreductase [bacterium]